MAYFRCDRGCGRHPDPGTTGNVETQSNYNRQLPTLQCYSPYVLRQFRGTLSASAALNGTSGGNNYILRPHNAELRLVTSARQSWLYLSTFGRSVWRAPVHGFA